MLKITNSSAQLNFLILVLWKFLSLIDSSAILCWKKKEEKFYFNKLSQKIVSMVIENNFLVSNCSEIQMVFFSIFN